MDGEPQEDMTISTHSIGKTRRKPRGIQRIQCYNEYLYVSLPNPSKNNKEIIVYMKKVVYEFTVKMKYVYPVNEMKDFV